jgi:hypothetical protein
MLSQHPTDAEIHALIAKVVRAARVKGPDGSLEAYAGDEYFVSDWDAPFEQAVAEVQQSLTLYLIISIHGLEHILADKYATAGLQKCLNEKDRPILSALAAYATGKNRGGKPGPRPKDGKYIGEIILALDEQGYTNGEIAMKVYDDSKMTNKVAAHLTQMRKKLKQQSAPSRSQQ